MERVIEAIKNNDLKAFVAALHEQLTDQPTYVVDSMQMMIDYCLENTNNTKVRQFITGINGYKKLAPLSEKQIQCVKSTYNSLKAIEHISGE